MSVMLYPCMLCVACLTVFLNCLVKQFAMCLGVVAIILLVNVMEVFSVRGGALLIRPCMVFQRVCVCCACDPNEHLSGPSIMLCLCFCMSESIASFRSLRAGSQVFALLMLFICLILHTMTSGKSMPVGICACLPSVCL